MLTRVVISDVGEMVTTTVVSFAHYEGVLSKVLDLRHYDLPEAESWVRKTSQ